MVATSMAPRPYASTGRASGPWSVPQVEPVGFQPVRLPLERFAFEIADGLPDFCDDRALRSVSIRQTEPTRE